MEHLKLRIIKYQWGVQVWLCRRFLENMTVDKIAVLAHVTGLPATTILNMHPACREIFGGRA